MEKQLFEQLGALLNKSADEVADLYSEDGNLKEDIDAVETLREWIASEKTRIGESQRKRGIKEGAQKWEKRLTELTGDASLKADDLYQALKEKMEATTAPPPEDKELTPEQLKTHPLFQDLVAELRTERDTLQTTLQEKESEWQRKSMENQVISRAFAALDNAKWKGGEDEQTRAARRRMIQTLLGADIQSGRFAVEDGKIVVLDQNGQPLQDKDFNTVDFDRYVLRLNPFGVHQHDKGKGSPPPSNGTAPSGGEKLVIRSQEEYDSYLRKNPSKQGEAAKAYAAYLQAQEK